MLAFIQNDILSPEGLKTSAKIIFWLCAFLTAHTYLFYPFLLRIIGRNKILSNPTIKPAGLPLVSIVIAAHNEEKVLNKKFESIKNTTYPQGKIEILIGTDACTDSTGEIISVWQNSLPIQHIPFETRTGKPGIINHLATLAKGEILIMTDANVYFTPELLVNLVKHFSQSDIGIVGSNIINTNIKADGISYQERTYLLNENKIKYLEGSLWGAMIGAFGGCYAIKKALYSPVPQSYFMDDFYITMAVLTKNKKAILDLDAVCYEDISNIIEEEFRRKVRISIGNFQNLSTFWKYFKNPFSGKGFAFISHKLLRWLTPFFLIANLLTSFLLSPSSELYKNLFFLQSFLLFIPIIDFCLRKINLQSVLLRFITHFYSMNLALLIGYFKYLKGVKSNVWEPTKRFQ